MSECGGVRIQFPPSGSKSDEVKLHGPQEDVERAKTMLLDLADDQVRSCSYRISLIRRHGYMCLLFVLVWLLLAKVSEHNKLSFISS